MHDRIIYYFNVAACSLSIMGALFIIIVFFLFRDLQKLPFRLIFYFTVSDLFHSIGDFYTGLILPYYESYTLCQIQGFLISYFSLSSIIWSACIAHAISKTLLQLENIEKFERYYLAIGYLAPLLCFLTRIYMDYGYTLGWCWIYQTTEQNEAYYIEITMRMGTYYIPLWTILIYISLTYIKILRYLSGIHGEITDQNLKDTLILKMKAYPIILLLCQIPVTLIRIISFWVTPPWWAMIIAGVGTSINGFINSIAYGATHEVKRKVKKLLGLRQVDTSLALNYDELEDIIE